MSLNYPLKIAKKVKIYVMCIYHQYVLYIYHLVFSTASAPATSLS